MDELAYCATCRDEVEFYTQERTETTKVDGSVYTYPVKQAYCKKCGNEASYMPYLEEAGEAFSNVVRTTKGIVSLETVRDLPKKYNIGKRPLSKLFGWGELTYSRFMDGAVPSKEYSDKIKLLYENPNEYYSYLKNAKSNLTEHAYNKSKNAVERILRKEYPGYNKVQEVAYFFMSLANGDLTNAALNKLIYYAHGFSFHFLKEPLLKQKPKAWTYGPVYGQVWHDYDDLVQEDFTFANVEENSPFSSEEEEFLNAIYDAFGKYSGSVLSEMTHKEAPWKNARKRAGVAEGEPCEEPIGLQEIQMFFEEQINQYDLRGFDQIKNYADKRYIALRN